MQTVTPHTNSSRSPTDSLPGAKRFASAVWYRSKAKLKDVLEHEESDFPTCPLQAQQVLPPEIFEMIIAHLAYDTRTLKVCAATCFMWYNIAIPHLHHTLKFRQWSKDDSRKYLHPLEFLHKLDLLSFVKQVQFSKALFGTLWISPTIFDFEKLQYFRALENLQDLTIPDLDFSKFPMGPVEYFGHFSPTLRSVALIAPKGTRQQVLDFLKLFPKLDDVKISDYRAWTEEALNTLPALMEGRLRGRLTLENLDDEVLLKDMIVAYGGMQFTSMDLHHVQGIQLVLEACADTLETVCIRLDGTPQHQFLQVCDLSRNTALRSLEVLSSSISDLPKRAHTIKAIEHLLSTITSPAFSEIVVVFSELDVRWPPKGLDKVLRELYGVKRFQVAFCLETLEKFMAHNLHQLTLETKRAAAVGTYDFLPSPPLVFSRTATMYDRYPSGICHDALVLGSTS